MNADRHPAATVTISAEELDRLAVAVGQLIGLLAELRTRQEDGATVEPADVVELAAHRACRSR